MRLPFEWFDGEGKYAPQEAFPLWIIAGEELEHLVESYVPCFLLDIHVSSFCMSNLDWSLNIAVLQYLHFYSVFQSSLEDAFI